MVSRHLRQLFTARRSLREAVSIIVGLAYGLGLALVLLNVQGRIAIESTDVFVYGDTARQIAAGHGISTRMLQPFVTTPLMPQTTWPPLYPLLVAQFMLLGMPVSQALLVTPIVVLTLCGAVFLWYVARRFGLLPAVLFAAFTLSASPLLRTAAQPLTEGVFFGFSLLAALAFFEAVTRSHERVTVTLGLLAGILFGSLGAIRYLGWSLGPAVLLLLVILKRKRLFLALLIGFLAMFLPLALRNFVFLREFSNERFPSDIGFFLNFQHAFEGLGKDFLNYQLWQSVRNVLLLALATLGLVAVRGQVRQIDRRAVRFGLLLTGFAAAYLAGMVVLRSFAFFDELKTSRFVTPVEWLALAGLCVLAGTVIARVRIVALATGLVIILLGIQAVPVVVRQSKTAPLFTTGPLIAWAARTTEPRSLIVSNHGQAYAFHLNRSVVVLRKYRAPETPEALTAWVENWRGQFSNIYWVLSQDLSPDRYPPPVVALSNGEGVPDYLERLPDPARKILAYRVRWEALAPAAAMR